MKFIIELSENDLFQNNMLQKLMDTFGMNKGETSTKIGETLSKTIKTPSKTIKTPSKIEKAEPAQEVQPIQEVQPAQEVDEMEGFEVIAYSPDRVQAEMMKVAQNGKRQEVKELLEKYGASKFSELKQSDYVAFMADLKGVK